MAQQDADTADQGRKGGMDGFDDPVAKEESKRPMAIGIAYLAFLLVTGLLVLLVAGRLIEF